MVREPRNRAAEQTRGLSKLARRRRRLWEAFQNSKNSLEAVKMMVPGDLKTALYFGCLYGESGHYVIKPRLPVRINRSEGNENANFLMDHDGLLAPKLLKYTKIKSISFDVHIYKEFDVIAFWDMTVDSRPGSNSMFLLVDPKESICRTPRNLLIRASEAFPGCWARFEDPFIINEIIDHINA